VTGIAGPDGGSAEKPVGLTYVGVADDQGVDVRRVVWSGDRAENRRDSGIALLELVLERATRFGAGAPP
jgi:nicotinamide mononucleotide (NMN) deamidase PncC